MPRKMSSLLLLLPVLAVASVTAQDARPHAISPLKAIPQKSGGFEIVSGDPDKPGAPVRNSPFQ
jgi:hypothetical protein